MGLLDGKTAIVTGAARGIGKAIALKFASEGANIAFTDLVIDENAENTAKEIEAMGVKAKGYASNAANFEDTAKVVEAIHADFGRIDILVNNAANVALKDGRVDELTLEMWDAILESDLRGTFYATKCAIPYMKEIGGGAIVNIGSMASCAGDLGSTAYACAKAGVDIFTQYVALQYGKDNIRCNCIRPGLIVTPENEAKVPQMLKDIFLGSIMVNRYGCPEDIAHAAVYFGSDESTYTTGQIINVDGGMNSHAPTVAQFRQMNSRTW